MYICLWMFNMWLCTYELMDVDDTVLVPVSLSLSRVSEPVPRGARSAETSFHVGQGIARCRA